MKRQRVRSLRRERTDAETAMWRLLRNRRFAGVKFRRQVPFKNYILDFVCFEQQIVIEIDGSQHLDSRTDKIRDAALAREGFRSARYWNNDVLQRPHSVSESLFHLLHGEKG
jgi:very-short-patch-repair endonuclease